MKMSEAVPTRHPPQNCGGGLCLWFQQVAMVRIREQLTCSAGSRMS